MAENRKDQQGQGNPGGQKEGQQQQGTPRKAETPDKRSDEDEGEGTKLPGRESRTPVAGNESRDKKQGSQQEQQQNRGTQGGQDQNRGNQGGQQQNR